MILIEKVVNSKPDYDNNILGKTEEREEVFVKAFVTFRRYNHWWSSSVMGRVIPTAPRTSLSDGFSDTGPKVEDTKQL